MFFIPLTGWRALPRLARRRRRPRQVDRQGHEGRRRSRQTPLGAACRGTDGTALAGVVEVRSGRHAVRKGSRTSVAPTMSTSMRDPSMKVLPKVGARKLAQCDYSLGGPEKVSQDGGPDGTRPSRRRDQGLVRVFLGDVHHEQVPFMNGGTGAGMSRFHEPSCASGHPMDVLDGVPRGTSGLGPEGIEHG